MVVPKPWRNGPDRECLDLRLDEPAGGGKAPGIGILAFEAAGAMCSLVSLHRSLSDPEILKLRSETMRSRGVAYLNSTDQALLLRLACAEFVADLDRAAAAASRLASRCQGALAQRFDRVYANLKAGSAYLDRIPVSLKGVEKRMRSMERHVAATARLYEEMQVLGMLESSKRKWDRYSGPIPLQKPSKAESVKLELKSQREKVLRLRKESLWNQSFDKAVRLMLEAVCGVFARICAVFGRFVPTLPPVLVSPSASRASFVPARPKLRLYSRFPAKHSSGPLERPAVEHLIIPNSCPIFRTKESEPKHWSRLLQPAPNTVGGAGLALRYANAIALAEKMLTTRSNSGEPEAGEAAAREELYEMLPAGLRAMVRSKLRACWKERGPMDGRLAQGWKEAVERILAWLGPVASDTIRWHEERHMDWRQRFDPSPRALMLQTLHFSDLEKTEAAIVEVLVGLSCVCWYGEQRRGSLRVSCKT
ncbi:protein PSK SIMULATOR 3-like [Phoenix dactylifera]|uniref:Protein PSK SIMULATOR 3-like n=1 Tax=Phoenix dactylifera TaxID=42345 RepID=A0A8B7BUE4_PHODC|nr:protein PSK SIMULATOR 3-like [Phoenix dactylifera]